MDLGLGGRKAAISGASDGLGYAAALALADEGCDVAISARGQEQLDKAVAEIEAKGVRAVGIACDMSNEDGCAANSSKKAAEGLGGIDILINCVGGMTPGQPRFADRRTTGTRSSTAT